ncbi:MAG TPA: DinB family protein [Ohtaekwangia sp.]|nr:DinB family protein [Ohtaekwangia sp.]
MKRPQLQTVPPFYKGYVGLVKDYDLMEALHAAAKRLQEILTSIPEEKGECRYQPEKWSIKELLCHMMDAERIFAYRALRIARNDKTPLAGFDEQLYAPEANAHQRSINQIAAEMKTLRQTTVDLYASFSEEMFERTGSANGTEISVLNLGYIIAGHESHHCNILLNRYLQK